MERIDFKEFLLGMAIIVFCITLWTMIKPPIIERTLVVKITPIYDVRGLMALKENEDGILLNDIIINLDNEVIIGLTPKQKQKQPQKQKVDKKHN